MAKMEQVLRLQAQALAGEAAEEALPVVGRVFAALREEVYRDMEGRPEPDMVMLRARLLVMRAVEERLGAYARGGEAARREMMRE